MVRQRIDADEVVAAAVMIVDGESPEELALSRVAEELGVQSSALYNHVDGLDGLRRAVAERGAEGLLAVLRDAVIARSGTDAFVALADAYRAFARRHPGQYVAALGAPDESDGRVAATQADIRELIGRVLDSSAFDGDVDRAVGVTLSCLHGGVVLEMRGVVGDGDPDARWSDLVALLIRGLGDD